MRHVKNPTRNQRRYLSRRKIDTEGIMIISDNPEYIEYVTKNGKKERCEKK